MYNYNYVILDPRPIPAATEANNKIFAEAPVGVLGIEVTIPALAGRCVLGNIDPQHSGGNADLAAIEVALTMELPPHGAILATVRADLDSIGAMTVLVMRAEGTDFASAMDRIRLIAESDKFSRSGWPGPRPLPTVEHPFDDLIASAETDSRLAPIAAVVSDCRIPIYDRIGWLHQWLLTGEEPAGYRERWLTERRSIAEAIISGAIRVKLVADGRIARVISNHRAATSIGYSMSPVVIALNPEFQFQGGKPHRKFTLCQFTSGYVNLLGVRDELNELEPGWGGSPTIIGSPQGMSSTLTMEQVVEVVARHLTMQVCQICYGASDSAGQQYDGSSCPVCHNTGWVKK